MKIKTKLKNEKKLIKIIKQETETDYKKKVRWRRLLRKKRLKNCGKS